jgi:hypothetical protein
LRGRTNLVLPRKEDPKFEHPDLKQRPTTPVKYAIDKIPIPRKITVPAYFPDMPSDSFREHYVPGPNRDSDFERRPTLKKSYDPRRQGSVD